jgi:hypothetical protein
MVVAGVAVAIAGVVTVAGAASAPSVPGEPAPTVADQAIDAPIPSPSPSPSPTPSSTPRPVAFVSSVHRYVVMLPDGWTARRASRADVPDRFDGPGGRQFAVVAVTPPSSGFTDAWLDEHIATRQTSTGACLRAGRIGSAPYLRADRRAAWSSVSIGDLHGRQRMACGFVDAVVWRDDQAWLLGLGNPRSQTGDVRALRELATTFRALPVPSTPTPTPTPWPTPTPVADSRRIDLHGDLHVGAVRLRDPLPGDVGGRAVRIGPGPGRVQFRRPDPGGVQLARPGRDVAPSMGTRPDAGPN